MRKRKKGEAKFSPRSYRFSSRTQSLISKLSQMTGKEQNDVVRKALEMYEGSLKEPVEAVTVKAPEWIYKHNEQEAINQNYPNPHK